MKSDPGGQSTGRKTLLALVLVFLLPVAAAQLVLRMGWYQGGVTNHGELLQQSVQLTELTAAMDEPKWMLILAASHTPGCDNRCKQARYLMQQTYTALGREQDRVALVEVRSSDHGDPQPPAGIILYAGKVSIPALPETSIYLADPLGRLVLRYPLVDEQQLTLTGKGMLTDLKRLLKQSKIG